ncbi:hypothetical protein [Wenzhouxiangella marina]|nr:hypothetical protein [Wenzhouxiangella marina]MBB6086862.1 hypothetical protein [Wenzhouxiangella marina]
MSDRSGAWIRRVLALALLLLSGALAAQDRAEDEAPTEPQARTSSDTIADLSCRDQLDRPGSWLDRSHSYMNRQLCEPAAWFDGFFGDSRSFEETPVGTFFRLRNSLQWDQREGWSVGVRVRANVLLPRVSERLRLLITSDDDLSGQFEDGPGFDEEDEQTRLGLRFIASEGARSQLDLDGTVRVSSGGLNPRVRARYRHVRGLSSNTLARATQSVFWERDEGFGTTSRFDWEWLPNRDRLLRWTAQGTFSEESDGVDWRSSLIGFQQLDPKTAVRTELGLFGYTRPDFKVEEYFVAVRYRRQFLRPWLFFELQPQHAWPLDPNGGDRRTDWRFTMTLEIQFENERSRQSRLRRYLGGEDDVEAWDDELPVPVDAPGDRVDDPVLKGDRKDGESNGDRDG